MGTHDMVSYLISISSDVLANLVLASTLLVGVALTHMPRRARMRRFFGLRHGGRVSIVLSNIWVDASRSVIPVRTGGYRGQASSLGEYRYASELGRTMERDSGVPRVLQFFVSDADARRVGRAQVDIRLGPKFIDPQKPADYVPVETFSALPASTRKETMDLVAGSGTLILVGSQVYNAAVLYVAEAAQGLTDPSGGASFGRVPDPDRPEDHKGVRAIRVPGQDFKRGMVTRNGRELFREYCLVQRVRIGSETEETTVFLCSGFSTVATVAGLQELAHWEAIQRDVAGGGPFVAIFEVLTPTRELVNDGLSDDVKIRRVYLSPAKKSRGRTKIPKQRADGSAAQDAKDPVQKDRNR